MQSEPKLLPNRKPQLLFHSKSRDKSLSNRYIANVQQGQQRIKQLNHFHSRNSFTKRKSLEKQFKQNFRFYVSLNQQKSTYEKIFYNEKRNKKKQKMKCQRLLQMLPKMQEVKYLKEQVDRVNRLNIIPRKYRLLKNKEKDPNLSNIKPQLPRQSQLLKSSDKQN